MCFCEREKVNSFNPDVNYVLKFLSELFQSGLGYSAINTAKSAISSLTAVVSNVEIGSNTLVQRFMRGIFNKKPCLPKNIVTWNVNVVLNHLVSVDITSCELRALSKKLVMLLALTTGQKCQTLHFLDIRNIEMDVSYVKFRIGDLLKQSKPGVHLHELYIESYQVNDNLCVVKCLKKYLEVTESLRSDTKLLVSTQKPYKGASKNTISNWIRETLKDSGIDLSIFSPHSTRSASTSAVSKKLPIDTILRTAGWKSDCVFRKHYKRPISNDSSFSCSILAEGTEK